MNIYCFIKIYNRIISCKIYPISADKLSQNDRVEIDEITEFIQMSSLYNLLNEFKYHNSYLSVLVQTNN